MLLDALYIVILIITFFVSYGITTSVLPSVPNKHIDVLSTCHDPSTGVQYSRHPKFLIYTPEKSAGGLGNTLVYFANAFFLATLTGRELIIGDHSGIGQMCRIINCGYPHVEEMSKVYPQYLSANAIRGARSITGGDLYKLYNGVTDKNGVTKSVHDDWSDLKVVTNSGYQAHVSGWWTQNETLALCIAKVTGCQRLYDNACAERYALQSLVKGPFQRALTEAEEKRIKGAPPSIMHSLVTLPRSYSQRLDVGICIRNQFHFFEKGHDISSPQYKAEVVSFSCQFVSLYCNIC